MSTGDSVALDDSARYLQAGIQFAQIPFGTVADLVESGQYKECLPYLIMLLQCAATVEPVIGEIVPFVTIAVDVGEFVGEHGKAAEPATPANQAQISGGQ